MELVYRKPAIRWGEALPLGNGQIGAMVYGGAGEEKITLTEHTFFSGQKADNANQKGAAEAFHRMREADAQGDYARVHKEAEAFIGRRENYGTHLPAGDLLITYENTTDLSEYERGLDLAKGKAWVVRKTKDNCTVEEIRVSHPDKVIMIGIRSEQRQNIRIRFQAYNGEGGMRPENHTLRIFADALEQMHCDTATGVHLEGAVKAECDGDPEYGADGILLKDCSDAVIYVAVQTDYGCGGQEPELLFETARERCERAAGTGEPMLICRHEEDMKLLTGGMELELDGTDSLSGKIPFLFQYGRYLLFCSSREDSVLPAHLQGIWNDNVACRIGWTCDMHLDINTQMNYWPAEFSGLSGCTAPLFRWIRDVLMPEGRKTAEQSYGLKGWVGEIVSNAWGYAAPYWASPIAPCPTGGVWILTHMWEHYLYTQDEQFLREQAFPLIREAVRFFQGYVYETEKGLYTCGPSISPENSFLYEGEARQISSGCTYEVLMIRELMDMFLQACHILGETSEELYDQAEKIFSRLLPYRILENGCIAEWNHDLPEVDPQHRHTSHLLGLYPFAQITPEETPELCLAAEKTLERKLTPPENWEDTGWARSMLMLYEARMQHGEKAYAHIRHMAENLLEPNGMVYHPPTRGAAAFDHVYELDGNTGLTSCIGEMLIQSHRNRIRLLPALPSVWKNGKVRRFHARGEIEVDLEWEDGKLKEAVLKSQKNKVVKVCWGKKEVSVELSGITVIKPEDFEKTGEETCI